MRASGGVLDAAPLGERPRKKTTYDETLELFNDGEPLTGIAKKRSLTLGTIADHLDKLVAQGEIPRSSLRERLPARLQGALPTIHGAFDDKGADKLAPAHAHLKGKYSYDELKLARILYSGERGA